MQIFKTSSDLNGAHGMYHVAADKYHSAHAISNSDISLFRQNPIKYKLNKEGKLPRRESRNLVFGAAFHTYILEEHLFDEQIAIEPKLDKRTKKGKEAYKEWSQCALGKLIISEKEFEDIKAMKQSLTEYRDSLSRYVVFDQLFTRGETEVSMFWRDDFTGLDCRGRVDYIKTGHIIDLKTTANASYEGFQESILKWGYHRQAAYYLDGARALTGENFNQFTFVCVEKEFPYQVAIWTLDEEFVQLGRHEYTQSLVAIQGCLETGDWYGYQKDPGKMKLPGK